METILRSEALRLIETGEPQSFVFVAADRRRGTGGRLIQVENWVMTGADFKKGTFNIKNPGNKHAHPMTVHSALILTLNGKKIING